jgi:hypothetical protein
LQFLTGFARCLARQDSHAFAPHSRSLRSHLPCWRQRTVPSDRTDIISRLQARFLCHCGTQIHPGWGGGSIVKHHSSVPGR